VRIMAISRTLLFLITLSSALFSSVSRAQITVDPGATSAPLQATQCAHASRGLFGTECTLDCKHACILPENRAQARLDLEALDVGSRWITSTIYTEFTVSSDPQTMGNNVTSSLIYDIEWRGWWAYGYAIFNWDPSVTITLWMTDRTTGKTVLSEVLHAIDADTFLSVEIVEVGLARDSGGISKESVVNLVRGHTYRAHLSIRIEAWAFSGGNLNIDYFEGTFDPIFLNPQGAWWNELKINIGADLVERIDLLEAKVNQLEEDLENHTHSYLTGRGKGHNNEEAESSPAILNDP